MTYMTVALVSCGLGFIIVSAIGALRLPDFYTRSHALGVLDTLGTLLILGGVAINYGFSILTAKVLILLMFIYIANPTITHVFLRSAYKSGLIPWQAAQKGKNA